MDLFEHTDKTAISIQRVSVISYKQKAEIGVN